MRQCDQENYAYTLINLIKLSSGHSLDDVFQLSDFDLLTLNLTDYALGTVSISDLQDILLLIKNVSEQLEKKNHTLPTYQEMRIAFMPAALFAKEIRKFYRRGK